MTFTFKHSSFNFYSLFETFPIKSNFYRNFLKDGKNSEITTVNFDCKNQHDLLRIFQICFRWDSVVNIQELPQKGIMLISPLDLEKLKFP